MLLIILLPLLSHLSYTAKGPLPGRGAAHSGLCPPSSSINQHNLLKTQPQANLIWELPQLRLRQVNLGCANLTAEPN